MIDKDPTITNLLSALDLSERGWQIVDHWGGDTCAVGIARTSEPRRLVYVSTFSNAPGRYDYECEVPSGPEDSDFETVERGESVTYDRLLDALARHLGNL